MSTPVPAPLLRVCDLRTHYDQPGAWPWAARQVIRALDGVSFALSAGRTLGIVGESGCGKTTLARTILRLTPATSGQVWFAGRDWLAVPPGELPRARRAMQMVFQDPATSLNPRLRVETLIGEGLQIHGLVRSRRERRERVADLLRQVGLHADDLDRYPAAFSGGQRQRIAIARALAVEPQLIICDEPTSALDVSVQSQILSLLADLQAQRGVAYLLISHDLGVIRHLCDEVLVMFAGAVVERGDPQRVLSMPQEPYTQRLVAAASGP